MENINEIKEFPYDLEPISDPVRVSNRKPRLPRPPRPPRIRRWPKRKPGRKSKDELEAVGLPAYSETHRDGIPYREHVICSMLASGASVRECAIMFNLKPPTIRRIANRNKELMDKMSIQVTKAIQNAAAIQMLEKLSSPAHKAYPIRSKK